MTACLRQAFPDISAQEIIRTVRASSSRFTHPDDLLGYGIPDMKKAWDLLYLTGKLKEENKPLVFPNPCTDRLSIALKTEKEEEISVTIFDPTGARILAMKTHASPGINLLHTDLSSLSAGTYIVEVIYNGRSVTQPVIKIK